MVAITEELLGDILDHATDGRPEEVCGVLGGDLDDRTVTSVHRATNAADDPLTTYEIAPEELYELIERIEDDGEDVVGFYHSHPSGPGVPSETDEAGAAWTNRTYLLVDLSEGASFSAWRWTGHRFDPEDVDFW